MKRFEDLNPLEIQIKMDELERKLKKKPNYKEKLWYDFASRNKGFEFMNVRTGKVISKLTFFNEHKEKPRELNLASENLLGDWRRRVKDGWTVVDFGNSVATAIRSDSVPKYKKRK